MTHDQLARRVAERAGISIRDARRVIDAAASEIAEALARGEAVTYRGVGTLRPPSSPGGRTRFRSAAGSKAGGGKIDPGQEADREPLARQVSAVSSL